MKEMRTLLIKKGLFTRLDSEVTGVNGHNREDVQFWRKVLDEMALGGISANTSAREHSYKWFFSTPGTVGYYIDDNTGREIKIDEYEEFCYTCELANLDPVMVRTIAKKLFKEDDPNAQLD